MTHDNDSRERDGRELGVTEAISRGHVSVDLHGNRPASVKSGEAVDQLETGNRWLEHAKDAGRVAVPGCRRGRNPQLATLTHERFSDPAWIFQPKLDGERRLALAGSGGSG